MQRGYIKIWRKLEDSGLLQMHGTLALFMFILMKATHKKTKIGSPIGVIELEPGQYISGRHKLSAAVGLSERETRTCLSRLEELDILSIKTTNRFSIYTIVNYSNYQDVGQQIDQQTTNRRPTDDQQTTTKQTHKHLSIKEKPLCTSSNDECATDGKINSLYTKSFLAFWEIYPHKKSKGYAAKVFSKIKAVEYPSIRVGLEAAINSSAWKKNNGEFIPHPGTWLQDRGWEDEQSTPAADKPFDMQEFMRAHT
jgi:hypothetical protein